MPTYFDSSVLLSILRHDVHAEKAARLWSKETERVSSILLEVECLVVLRRTADHFKKNLPKNWLATREKKLQHYLQEVELRYFDEDIVKILHQESRLSRCKTLDAIHLATALFFRASSNAPFSMATFDEKMATIAQKLGFN